MEQFDLFAEQTRPLTVSEAAARIRGALEEFGMLEIEGEISGVREAASGHYYFTLKDDAAQLRAVMYRSAARWAKVKPREGVAVVARGRLDFYDARGEAQFIVERLAAKGEGELRIRFEKLKQKLEAEGLFADERKRPLPPFPERIGVVTSVDGAAVRDILNVLSRRFPGIHVRIHPALVQGEGSAAQVCRALDWFGRSGWPDVVIVARGGGSLEDLWTFNEETVARAIAACPVPVISAVGHETDFTIADFVADLRAPTPSAAAELVVPTRDSLIRQLTGLRDRAAQSARYRVARESSRWHRLGVDRPAGLLQRALGRRQQRLDELDYRLRALLRQKLEARVRALRGLDARLKWFDPRPRVARDHRRLASAWSALTENMRRQVETRARRLEGMAGKLSQLDPTTILSRGYAIVTRDDGAIVKGPEDAPAGTRLELRVARGRIAARSDA